MSERIKIKTEIQSRKFRLFEVVSDAKDKIDSIKDLLAGSSAKPLSGINCVLVYDLAKKLKSLSEEYDGLETEIVQLEKELE